jgi:hypothetical protein
MTALQWAQAGFICFLAACLVLGAGVMVVEFVQSMPMRRRARRRDAINRYCSRIAGWPL